MHLMLRVWKERLYSKELAEYLDVTERTIHQEIKEFNDKYLCSKGEVFRSDE